jgi:hypothetical protein
VDDRVDLDRAVLEIARRLETWRKQGLRPSEVTWRDKGEGWQPLLKTERSAVVDPDSIGVAVRKADQLGRVVLYRGGWADLEYWSGNPTEDAVVESPGWEDWLTVERFGDLLDRFAALFES